MWRSDAFMQPPRRIPRQLLLTLIQGVFLARFRQPSGAAKAVGIDKPDKRHPQGQDDQSSANNHNVTPRSATGDACLARSIARRSAPSRRGFQCGFQEEDNEAPAGEKPSGLPARLQETSVKARSPDFLRSPDHTV